MSDDKKLDLLKRMVSKSIPVSQQTFEIMTPEEEADPTLQDQYIVDGQALRELLRSYRLNYGTIRKHKDWIPKVNFVQTSHKIVKDPTSPKLTWKQWLVILSIAAIFFGTLILILFPAVFLFG